MSKKTITVCRGPWCSKYRNDEVEAACRAYATAQEDPKPEVTTSNCLGLCSTAPNVRIDEEGTEPGVIRHASPERMATQLDQDVEPIPAPKIIDVDQLFDDDLW
jgi:NADH:ubiquinone oxidoreductase subunit E